MGLLYVLASIFGALALSLERLLAEDAEQIDARKKQRGVRGILLSLRFWIHGVLAFGMAGTLLHYLELAGSALTLVMAIGIGVLSGLVATYALRLFVPSGGA